MKYHVAVLSGVVPVAITVPPLFLTWRMFDALTLRRITAVAPARNAK
jgi:hypothetical protein